MDLLRGYKNILTSRLSRLLLGVALVVGLCLKLHVSQRISQTTFEVNWVLAVLGIMVTVALISVRAWRWNVILGDLGRMLSIRDLARIYSATFFLGLVSPAKIGEGARIWLVRDQARSVPAAAFSVAFDRVFDLLPTLLITAVFGAAIGAGDKTLLLDGIRGAFVVLALVLVVLLFKPALFQAGVQRLASKLLARLEGPTPNAVVSRPVRRETVLKAFVFSMASQALLLLQTYLFARAVSADINPVAAFAVVTMSSVVASLPLSIGGVGTREATVVWALASLGLHTEQAIAFSLLGLLNFLAMLGLSMVAFINQPLHIAQHLARFRRAHEPAAVEARAVTSGEG